MGNGSEQIGDLLQYRFSTPAASALSRAGEEAALVGATSARPVHLACVLLRAPDAAIRAMSKELGIRESEILDVLSSHLASCGRVDVHSVRISRRLIEVVTVAASLADEVFGGRKVDPLILFCAAWRVALEHDDPKGVFAESLPGIRSVLEAARAVHGYANGTCAKSEATVVKEPASVFDDVGTDLVRMAREGQLNPVFGRTDEIERMTVILTRRQKCNPVLVGEAGVGKTAVVEGLASAIAGGYAPEHLLGVRIIALDMMALRSARPDPVGRLREIIAEATRDRERIILFIDEIHTVIKSDDRMDFANAIKPALSRGKIRVIGATTFDEYQRYIERDRALERRFDRVSVKEPSDDETLDMLRAIAPHFSLLHDVRIAEESLQCCVRLGGRFLPTMRNPDRAISILDSACATVRMSRSARPSAIDLLLERERLLDARLTTARAAPWDGPSRPGDLEEQIRQVRLEHESLEAQWREQRALVEEIDQLRREFGEAEADPSEMQDRHDRAMERLRAVSGSARLVHVDVTRDVIASVVASMSGVAIGRVDASLGASPEHYVAAIAERVVGQPIACDLIGGALMDADRDLTAQGRPRGVLLLAGPKGTGKSQAAKAVGEVWAHGAGRMHILRMSEYAESHARSRLLGTSPGYVGFESGGILTEAARRDAHAVFLLEEIERAHPDVLEIFAQIFDSGRATDGRGRVADFRNAIFIMTTGADPEWTPEDAANDAEESADHMREALRGRVSAGILDQSVVVPFAQLSLDALRLLAERMLRSRMEQIREVHGMVLELPADAADRVIDALPASSPCGWDVLREIDREWMPWMHEQLRSNFVGAVADGGGA